MTTLYIVRGLPGSGKSTYAQSLQNAGLVMRNFEADEFFIDNCDGKYVFDPSRLKKAHEWCKNMTDMMLRNKRSVSVSNTFTRLWEIQPYLDMANEYGATVKIIKCCGKWENIHNVPNETIEKMRARWEDIEGEESVNCQ